MQQEYRDYLGSADWKQKAKEAREYYHYKCAVCDLDYKERGGHIEVHHMHYWKFKHSVIGHEHKYFDLRLLCEKHHPKGKLSAEAIQRWRKNYRFRKRWRFIFAPLEKLQPKRKTAQKANRWIRVMKKIFIS